MMHILVVEPNVTHRAALSTHLEHNGFEVTQAEDIGSFQELEIERFSLMLANAELPSGCDILAMARGIPVILVADDASVQAAVQAIRHGADDYLSRPFEPDDLLAAIEKLIGSRQTAASPPRPGHDWLMIGESPPMLELFERIHKVAPTESTVLIQGESGTGKELVARALHSTSKRRLAPMISLNCAAIPESLIESELFGHERGAFTGANAARNGLIEAADQGTLFLDEVGELPMEAQARLLRVLQDGEIRRVGSTQTRRVDVRLITATHRDLRQLTLNRLFREDLYYRLNVVTLAVPPLRSRGADILAIAKTSLDRTARKLNKLNLHFSDAALSTMAAYEWPGNVRELENAVERAVILADDSEIGPELLAIDPTRHPPLDLRDSAGDDGTSLEDYFVRFVLDHQDHLTETELAQKLGISRKSLWERRQRLNIPRRGTRKRGPRRNQPT